MSDPTPAAPAPATDAVAVVEPASPAADPTVAAATPLPDSPGAPPAEDASRAIAPPTAVSTTAAAAAAATDKDNTRPLVVSGPSGSGKSTLINRLFKEYPDAFGFSVSHTTRSPREGEKDGVNYHFVDQAAFDKLVGDDAFIEHAEFSGNSYGTSKAAVKSVTDAGKICVLDIEMHGVKSIKAADMHAHFVFVRPPSMEEVEKRLKARGTETDESLAKRLETAKAELEYADSAEAPHEVQITNDKEDDAYATLKEWVLKHYDVKDPKEAAAADAAGAGSKKKGAKVGKDGKKSKFCVVM